MDRIDSFKIFVLVADTASFTKAAEISDLPRSTVSSAIKLLEQKFEVRLFYRTTRRVSLTNDGQALLEKCKTLIDEVEKTENIFKASKENISGKLTVDVPSRIGAHLIAPELNHFFKLYPNINLVLGSSDRAVDLVNEGIDCAIRVGDLTSSSLIAKKLGSFKVINCASPLYLAKHGTPHILDDIKEHYLIQSLSSLTGMRTPFKYIDTSNKDKQVDMKVSLTVNNAETRIASAVAGLGIIQIPAFDVEKHLINNKLKEILVDFQPKPKVVNAVYPHRKHLSQRVQVFIEWFEEILVKNKIIVK